MHLRLETLLEREHGAEIRDLARAGAGFGIVAGTGTGKTLAIRPIAETILGTDQLRVGVVNREREATPETPTWNVVIVTTGIARRWFQSGDILPRDTLLVDEIHQTSAELELCLALGKRAGCRFIWLSATVDPAFYKHYLESAEVLETTAFDPAKAARVIVLDRQPMEFLDERFLSQTTKDRRGVGVFLPTRAAVEDVAELVERRAPRITAAYYHGGEPIRVIRPFLEGTVKKPYVLAMTAAGQSALNVHGLDTVVIDDTRFYNEVDRGRNVLTRTHLGANEILQMAGRVHGRVEGGRVFLLSDRRIEFSSLRPVAPEFQLAGDSERVALTTAALGVRADELDLPVPLDKGAYRRAMALLESRGIIEDGKLTPYGRDVEALPVERPWAELLVHASEEMVPFVAVMASIESLHRMTRDERDLDGVLVAGSDHLTAYNLYVDAYRAHGYVGEVYGLPRHLFHDEIEEWAEERGALVKSVEDAALGMASIYRALELRLPTDLRYANDGIQRQFADLLARIMPFDLVMDERAADGTDVRVSKTSVSGNWGAIAGTIRYFADRMGVPRAAIEGTQIPFDAVRRYAVRGEAEIAVDWQRKRSPLLLRRRTTYFGFQLGGEQESIDEFPGGLEGEVRHALAHSLAREEARHPAVKRNHAGIVEARELWRRSGGTTPRLGLPELTAMYEAKLGAVRSLDAFRAADLTLDLSRLVPEARRAQLLALPGEVMVRDREVPIDYDVEEENGVSTGVARLRLPEKLARTLTDAEIPALDRPVRFIVMRGQRGAARGRTLDELQDALDAPFTEQELEREFTRPSRKEARRDRVKRGRRHRRR